MEWTRWTSRNRTFFKGGSFSKSTVSRCPTRPLYYYLIFFKKETKTYQMHLGVCFVTLFHQCFKQRDREKQEKREKPKNKITTNTNNNNNISNRMPIVYTQRETRETRETTAVQQPSESRKSEMEKK
jgi:hypothetical protein